MAHPNTILLQRLYSSLDQHHPAVMADCYHPDATFRDIAFDLKGKDRILAMWQMICSGDIRTTFEVVSVDDNGGVVKLVDNYTFTDTGRRVRNVVESRFRFQDGLIVEHCDLCDPRVWASAALGGLVGFLAGRLRFLRTWKAEAKLRRFQESRTRYATSEVR